MVRNPSVHLLAFSAFVLFAPTLAFGAAPQPAPAPASKLPAPSITLAEAKAIIDGAITYARDRNVVMAAIVVDTAGMVVASERMDGVSPANIQYAEGKAFAAVMQRQTTEQLGQLVKDRPDRYYAIQAMNPGKMYLGAHATEALIMDGIRTRMHQSSVVFTECALSPLTSAARHKTFIDNVRRFRTVAMRITTSLSPSAG